MSEKKKKDKQELSRIQEEAIKSLTVDQVMKHPAVQKMNEKLEEMRQLVQGLPEAIWRAVAEAQRSKKLPNVSGPPVQLMAGNDGVEFHRKGRIVQNGKEVAPEGPTQTDFVKDLGEMRGKAGSIPELPSLPAPSGEPPPQPRLGPSDEKQDGGKA